MHTECCMCVSLNIYYVDTFRWSGSMSRTSILLRSSFIVFGSFLPLKLCPPRRSSNAFSETFGLGPANNFILTLQATMFSNREQRFASTCQHCFPGLPRTKERAKFQGFVRPKYSVFQQNGQIFWVKFSPTTKSANKFGEYSWCCWSRDSASNTLITHNTDSTFT